MVKGVVIDQVLVKRGKQVVKFFKYNGYAVAESDIEKVHGVKLYTQYDGILYADRHMFYKHGIPNTYKDEKQLVLPLEHWEPLVAV